MTEGGHSDFRTLDREGRQRCWAAREQLFSCLDALDDVTREADETVCSELRTLLRASCPESWVVCVMR